MIVQEEWVSITTTPDVVERHLTEPALMSQWRSPLVQLTPLTGDLMTLGSTHKMSLVSLGLAGAEYTVTERDGQHLLMRISGLWEGTELWRWFIDSGRVVVQNRVEYDMPHQGLRIFALTIGRFVANLDMRIQLFRLRELIEGPPALGGGTRPAQRITIEE